MAKKKLLRRVQKASGIGVVIALLMVIVFLLVFIIFSTGLVSFPSFSLMEQQMVTAEVGTIDSEVLGTLNHLYNSLSNEYVGCLDGRVDDGALHISGFKETEVAETSQDHIVFKACTDGIGSVHSHPEVDGFVPLCQLSSTDAFSFGRTTDEVSCVQCGEDKITCFTRDNLEEGIMLEVGV